MNKFHALCCAFLFLTMTHHINSAEVNVVDQWDAKKYKNNSSPQFHFAQWALEEFKLKCGGLKQKDRVLDFGCGNGTITNLMAQKIGEQGFILGVDSSQDMLRQAMYDYPKCFFANAECIAQTESRAKFSVDETFNVVTAFCSIHWIKDQEKIYQNISRKLQSNGTFVGLISDKDASIIKAYYNAFEYPQWNNYFKNYTPSYYPSDKKSMEEHLNAAGLTSIIVEKANIPMMTMEEESFLSVLAATPGVKDAIPQESYMDFMKDVLAEYVKIVPKDETGKIKIDAGLLLILAKKP